VCLETRPPSVRISRRVPPRSACAYDIVRFDASHARVPNCLEIVRRRPSPQPVLQRLRVEIARSHVPRENGSLSARSVLFRRVVVSVSTRKHRTTDPSLRSSCGCPIAVLDVFKRYAGAAFYRNYRDSPRGMCAWGVRGIFSCFRFAFTNRMCRRKGQRARSYRTIVYPRAESSSRQNRNEYARRPVCISSSGLVDACVRSRRSICRSFSKPVVVIVLHVISVIYRFAQQPSTRITSIMLKQ